MLQTFSALGAARLELVKHIASRGEGPQNQASLLAVRCRLLLLCVCHLGLLPATAAAQQDEVNARDADGFQVLFDGTDLNGWKHQGNWEVDDGVITRTGKGGSLVYQAAKVPDDFELQFEWKVARGSNSGVYYRPGQYEYQILDNDVHADGKNPRTSAASLYFCMQPSHDATQPVGQWNQARIVCKGTVIQHWLNGEKVVSFDYSDPRYKFNVELLKARGADLRDRGAYLSLQDHGDPVWYRNIRLRALTAKDELDLSPVTPAEIPPAVLEAERKKLAGIVARRNRAKSKQSK